MKNFPLFFMIFILISGNPLAQEVPVQHPFQEPGTVSRGVFGVDDRKEATDAKGFEDYVRATAVMVPKSSFRNNRIYGGTLRQRLATVFGSSKFDPNVKFLDQPAVAQCTGFLIAPDILVTAGHCVLDMNTAKDFYWVFDYTNNLKYNSEEKYVEVKPENIFEVKEVMEAEDNDDDYLKSKDYSVLRLTKESGRKPYRFRTSGKVESGTRVFTVGTPTGLPLKLSENSRVVNTSPETWFMSDTDVFPGNSGGPVFDPAGWIEGILVRTAAQTLSDGELTADYMYDEACDCIKTVEFNEVTGTAGSQAHKINAIPEWILLRGIYDNIYYAIQNNLEDRFKDWSSYNWIFTHPYNGSRLKLENYAMFWGRYEMIDYMLDYTVDNYSDAKKRAYLTFAKERRDFKVLDLLIEHGIYIDSGPEGYNTFLQELVIEGKVDWVKKVLEYQPNVQVLDSAGNNLLHLAAVNGDMEMLQLLSFQGIKAGAKNHDKKLPEKIAKGAKHKEAAKYLKKLRKGKITKSSM